MSGEKIPVLDLAPEIEAVKEELERAFREVLDSGHFILGPAVERFEKAVGAYLGTRHAIGLNSGTDALVIGLRALGIGPGDEVVTTPFTFFATAEAISLVGATPVFADIQPGTFDLDPEAVRAVLSDSTRAILPVHLFGHAAAMDQLGEIAEEHELFMLEDVAQAFGGAYRGRKLGTLGEIGAFSFFPSKNLGGFGDGGLIATDDDDLAAEVRMLRAHGAKKKYFNETLGYNSRLDALQAALLAVKLPHIDEYNQGRRRVAGLYGRMLAEVEGVTVPVVEEYAEHVFHQYTVRIAGGKRDAVQKALEAKGVSTMVYYPVPVHRLPLYDGQYPACPVAEAAAADVLSLPIWPTMEEAKVARVVQTLRSALSG